MATEGARDIKIASGVAFYNDTTTVAGRNNVAQSASGVVSTVSCKSGQQRWQNALRFSALRGYAADSAGRSSRAIRSSTAFASPGSSPVKKPCAISRYSLMTTLVGGPSGI